MHLATHRHMFCSALQFSTCCKLLSWTGGNVVTPEPVLESEVFATQTSTAYELQVNRLHFMQEPGTCNNYHLVKIFLHMSVPKCIISSGEKGSPHPIGLELGTTSKKCRRIMQACPLASKCSYHCSTSFSVRIRLCIRAVNGF